MNTSGAFNSDYIKGTNVINIQNQIAHLNTFGKSMNNFNKIN